MLSRLGRMVIVACALPAYVRSRARELLDVDCDNEALREDLARAIGERDEARLDRDLARGAEQACYQREAAIARGHQDEVKILTREADSLRDDVQRLTSDRTAESEAHSREYVEHINVARELRSEVDRLTDLLADARTELEVLRKPAESSTSTNPTCAWCHGDRGVMSYGFNGFFGDAHFVCARCYRNSNVDAASVRARVAARAASCPSRRTSHDPIAAACVFGCGAPLGETCDPARAEVSP